MGYAEQEALISVSPEKWNNMKACFKAVLMAWEEDWNSVCSEMGLSCIIQEDDLYIEAKKILQEM